MSMLAIAWEPEIRGVLTVMIAVIVLCGSIYLIMATNMGARLAFLVVLAALFGWLFLMGITWWIYGIGLKGPDPTWAEVPGKTVLQDTQALYTAGVLQQLPDVPADATFPEEADLVADQLLSEGWEILDTSSPEYGQVQAQASVFLEEEGAFAAGEFQITEVFDHGWRSLSEDQRIARLLRLLPRAALRARRGGADRAGAHGTGPCPGAADDRRQRATPVRLHGP